MKPLLIVLIALLAGGCASMSEKECKTADWESVGYQDGTRGYNSGRVAEHSEACAKTGITPDRKLYEEGRNRGLEEFCTDRNGVRIGEQGGAYSGACPIHLEPGFMRGYDIGRELHDARDYMNRLQSEAQHIQASLQQREPALSDYERNQLLYRLREVEREYGRAESDYRRAERRARDF